jgi:hypothetical protein
MARTRKSRPNAKARVSRVRTKLRARAKRARKSSSGPASTETLDDLITAAARLLALPVEPQWVPAIRTNLEVNLRLAALVAEFDLPDEAEPAPVFRA